MVKRADLATLLVDDLQRLPFEPDGWRRFAMRLGKALHGPVILGTVELPSGVPVRTDHVLVDEASMADYAAHYYSLSPWRQWTETAPQGAVAGGAAINPLPPIQYEKTQFYADFLLPNHMHHGLSARICRDAREATDLAVLRSREKGPMTAAELHLVRYLMPHVRRALRVRHAIGASDLTGAGLLRDDIGVMVVDRLGRVLFANRVAHERLADSDGLTTARGGVLTAMHAPAQKLLLALVRFAVDGVGSFALRRGGDMLLPRAGRPPLRVTIVAAPLTGHLGPAALLLLRDPPAPPPPLVFRRFDGSVGARSLPHSDG